MKTVPPPEGETASSTGHLCDYLPADAWTLLVEPEDLHEQGKHYLERVTDPRGLFSVPAVFQQLLRFPSIQETALPAVSVETACHLRVESVERFSGNVAKLRDELDSAAAGDRVLIACHNEAECKRLGEVLGRGTAGTVGPPPAGDRARPRRFSPGRCRAVVVLSDHELFHREEARQILPSSRAGVSSRGRSTASSTWMKATSSCTSATGSLATAACRFWTRTATPRSI